MRKAKDGLTSRQRNFAHEVHMSGNATQAAIKVGYSERSAHVQGPRLLGKDAIKAELGRLRAETARDHKITRDWLVNKQRTILNMALDESPILDRYGKPTGSTKSQLSAANKAIENLAVLTGQWVDKSEVTTRNLDTMSDDELKAEEAKLQAELETLKAGQPTIN